MEGLGQPNHALHDGQIVRIHQHVAHEALVDLDLLGTQALEVGERGIAGAKVVQRKAHAQGLAAAHDVGHQRNVVQRVGLQDLQAQPARGHLGLLVQQLGQALAEAFFLQLHGVDVHAHRQIQALALPVGHLAQCAGNHPLPYVDADGVVLNGGQEGRWRQQPALGVLPADQCLGANDRARAHVDLGLVVQHEFAVLQPLANPGHFFPLGFDGLVVLHIEQVEAVLACLLGLVHGLVGVADEQVGLHTVGGVDGDAYAGRDLQQVLVHLHRVGGGVQHA